MAMAQVQAHHGYIQTDGRLVFDDARVRPPKNRKVTISWQEDSPIKKDLTLEQKAVIAFVEGIQKINADGFDKDTLEAFKKWDDGEFKMTLEERVL